MEEADIRTDAFNQKESKTNIVNNVQKNTGVAGMNDLIKSVLRSVQVLECPTVGTFAWEQSRYSCSSYARV